MKKLLIYGPRKSGTTLLQSLIDGHSEITMFPGEFKIKEFFKLYQNDRMWKEKYVKIAHSIYKNQSKTEQDHQIINNFFSFNSYYEELKRKSKDSADLKSLIDLESNIFSQHLGKNTQYLGYKEVGGNTEFIVFLFKILFPDSKIILLKRNPKSVVSSIIRDRKKKGSIITVNSIIGELLEAYRINRYIDLINNLNIGVFTLNYEDIISNTEERLVKVADYLELEFETILTVPTTLGTNTIVKTSSKKTEKVEKLTKSWKTGLSIMQILLIQFSSLILQIFLPNLQKN